MKFRRLGLGVSLLMTLGLFMLGCSKSEVVVEPESPDPEVPVKEVSYFIGYKFTKVFNETTVKSILKIDDSIVNLSPAHYSMPYDLAVENKVVHVVGKLRSGGNNYRVAYWKNGLLTMYGTSHPSSVGTAIELQGGNVHLAGITLEPEIKSPALYIWNNGKSTRFACCLAMSRLNDMAWNNGAMVYVGKFGNTSFMFKDGSALALANSGSEAFNISVIDGSDYVLGVENLGSKTYVVAVYKDDVEIFNHELTGPASAVEGYIDGKDYYYAINAEKAGKEVIDVYKNKKLLYTLSETSDLLLGKIKVRKGVVHVLANAINTGKSTPILYSNGKKKQLFAPAANVYLTNFEIK